MNSAPRLIAFFFTMFLGASIVAEGVGAEVLAQLEKADHMPTSSVSFGATSIEVPDTLLAHHYGLPEERLGWRAEQAIPDAEWPLLLEIARATRSDIAELVGMRQQKLPWSSLFEKFQFQPELLFSGTESVTGTEKVIGSEKAVGEGGGGNADGRFVDQAIVRFLASVTKKPQQEVVQLYRATPKFVLVEVATSEAERVAGELVEEESRGMPKPLPGIVPGHDPTTDPNLNREPSTDSR